MAYKRPESVLVVVYTRDGQVLMLRRRHPPDFWQSVTGSLEWGEDRRRAALRELDEETGLTGEELEDCGERTVFTIYPIFRPRYAPGTVENLEHVFRLRLDRPIEVTLDATEHREYRWLPKGEAAALATSHTNRDAILKWVSDA